ncbi:DEP domain-containing protein [Galdieria sulphuraria]|nr:DEP domain-containing protein [Galdieria sulphuraria]
MVQNDFEQPGEASENNTIRWLHLRIHNASLYQDQDVLVNPDFLQVSCGDILRLSKPGESEGACFLKVTDRTSIQGTKTEISISQNIAESFQFTGHSLIQVANLGPRVKPISFVEVLVKNQYLSSSEMWRLKFLLNGQCIYSGKILFLDRIQASVKSLFMDTLQVKSGLIGHETKFNFRSQSAKIVWLIEFSKELWEETMDGRLYFELVVELMERILERWNSDGLRHILSIVVFSRVFYNNLWEAGFSSKPLLNRKDSHRSVHVLTDENNRPYSDLYFPLLTNERVGHSKSIVPRVVGSLKRLFYRFPLLIGSSLLLERFEYTTNVDYDETKFSLLLPGTAENSWSEESNLLEAFNVCLNDFERHFIDRELKATGNHVVIFTASRGVWKVHENLIKLTKRRLMSNGVGWEILSVGVPITDQAPIFILQPSKNQMEHTSKMWKNREENPNILMHLSRSISIAQMERTAKMGTIYYKFPKEWFPLRFIGPRFPSSLAKTASPRNEIRIYMEDFSNDLELESSNFVTAMHIHDNRVAVANAKHSQVALLSKLPRSTSVDLFHSTKSREEQKRNPSYEIYTTYGKFFDMTRKSIYRNHLSAVELLKDSQTKLNSNHIKPWIEYETCEEPPSIDIQRRIMWNNLLEPSVLPLTTEFAPNSIFSKSYFLQYLYTLPLPSKSKSDPQLFSESARALVKELVCQRMVQDFQVVVHLSDEIFWKNLASPELYERTMERHAKSSSRRQKSSFPGEDIGQIRCVLAKGREYHELTVNPENYTVQVRRFVRVDAPEKSIPSFHYRYNLFCTNSSRFVIKTGSFSVQTDSINWNRLDQILVEGQVLPCTSEILMKELQARVVRFAIIPNGNKSTECISQFLRSITRGEIGFEQLPSESLDGYRSNEEQFFTKLDMGMFKGARHEWIILGVDKFLVPSAAFHWSLYWLVCEGGVVEDYIQFCFRRAKLQGLTCCRVPFDFVNSQSSWTISTVWYNINVVLWKQAIEMVILEAGLFLDKRDTENVYFVHQTGGCMVQWNKETESVYWRESNVVENTHSSRKHVFHSINNTIYLSKFVQTVVLDIIHNISF